MPQTFTDTAGRVWSLSIGTDTIKRVRQLLSVDLMEFVEGSLMGKLMGDVVLFVDVLYAICRPEAEARGVTDEQFGQAMSGDVLMQAEEALAESLFSFSHPSRRPAARTAWEKLKALRTKAGELATVQLADPRLDAMIEAQMLANLESLRQTLGGSSGSLREPSALTPAP